MNYFLLRNSPSKQALKKDDPDYPLDNKRLHHHPLIFHHFIHHRWKNHQYQDHIQGSLQRTLPTASVLSEPTVQSLSLFKFTINSPCSAVTHPPFCRRQKRQLTLNCISVLAQQVLTILSKYFLDGYDDVFFLNQSYFSEHPNQRIILPGKSPPHTPEGLIRYSGIMDVIRRAVFQVSG